MTERSAEILILIATIYSMIFVYMRLHRMYKKRNETDERYLTRLYGSYFALANDERLTHAAQCALYRGRLMPEQHQHIVKKVISWIWSIVLDDNTAILGPRWFLGITTHNRIVLAVDKENDEDYVFESEWLPGTKILSDIKAFGRHVRGWPSVYQLGFSGIGWPFIMLYDSVAKRRRGLWVSPDSALALMRWDHKLFYGSTPTLPIESHALDDGLQE